MISGKEDAHRGAGGQEASFMVYISCHYLDDFLADALFGGLGFLSLSSQDADLRKSRKVAA